MSRTPTIVLSAMLVSLCACGKEAAPAPAPGASSTPAPTAPPPNPLSDPGTSVPLDTAITSAPDASGTRLEAQGISFDIPPSWTQQQASNSMRAAQYAVPAPPDSGLAAGEFVVFRGIGGSASDNIARWELQMTDLAVPRLRATRTDPPLTIDSLVQFGTYSAGTAMSDQGPIPDWGFAGAVISGGPQGPVFLRLTGPKQVVDARMAEWGDLLKSIGPTPPGGTR